MAAQHQLSFLVAQYGLLAKLKVCDCPVSCWFFLCIVVSSLSHTPCFTRSNSLDASFSLGHILLPPQPYSCHRSLAMTLGDDDSLRDLRITQEIRYILPAAMTPSDYLNYH
jgi:hypothetical protein